jgi:hypothetical protein
MDQHNHHDHLHDDEKGVLEHHHTITSEILCHLPYAIFSVAFSMIVLSFLTSSGTGAGTASFAYRLFHNFHYLHLLFAATGAVLTFRRYSKNVVLGIAVGFAVPALFCTFSDAFLPYLGGKFVDLDMHFHWCFISHLDTVLPFLVVGMINGWVMSSHPSNRQLFYSLGFHFLHIFISSMASILYLVSFGFYDWWEKMGFVFTFLILAVLIPCTLSDIVVPVLFARLKKWKK